MQILDIAFSVGVEKCRSKTFSILSTMGLPFVPPLCSIAISLFIQCYLFYVHQCEKSCFHIPSQLHLWSFTHYVWEHVQYVWVMYSSKCEWQSVLCYLSYARLSRVSHVALTLILSLGTCVNLIWICVSCELLVFFSCPTFVLLWQILMHVKLQFREHLQVKS